MDQIKTIFCIGNQTQDTHDQTLAWAEKFGLPYSKVSGIDTVPNRGIFMSDLEIMSVDQIWQIADHVDLLIFLDQSMDSFDFVETYQTLVNLCRYKKHFMPVMFANNDPPSLWLNTLQNQQIYDYIVDHNIHDCNLVIKLSEVEDIDQFVVQLHQLNVELEKRRCRWLYYRAGKHESLHYEVTKVLLQHPEFVLLNPEVFQGDVMLNIKRRIYHHWVNLYLKKSHARS